MTYIKEDFFDTLKDRGITYFLSFDELYTDWDLSIYAIQVYQRLVHRTRLSMEEENREKYMTEEGLFSVIYPQEELAEFFKVNVRTIERAFKELEKADLIDYVKLPGDKAKRAFVKEFKKSAEELQENARQNVTRQNVTRQIVTHSPDKLSTTHPTKSRSSNKKTSNKKKEIKIEIDKSISTTEQNSVVGVEAKNSNIVETKQTTKKKSGSKIATMLSKIEKAKKGELPWSEIKPSHLAYYYKERHYQILKKSIGYKQLTDLGAFKDGFLSKYNLIDNPELAVKVIDELLNYFNDERRVSRGNLDRLEFNSLYKGYVFLGRFMELVFKRIDRKEKELKRAEENALSEQRGLAKASGDDRSKRSDGYDSDIF